MPEIPDYQEGNDTSVPVKGLDLKTMLNAYQKYALLGEYALDPGPLTKNEISARNLLFALRDEINNHDSFGLVEHLIKTGWLRGVKDTRDFHKRMMKEDKKIPAKNIGKHSAKKQRKQTRDSILLLVNDNTAGLDINEMLEARMKTRRFGKYSDLPEDELEAKDINAARLLKTILEELQSRDPNGFVQHLLKTGWLRGADDRHDFHTLLTEAIEPMASSRSTFEVFMQNLDEEEEQ